MRHAALVLIIIALASVAVACGDSKKSDSSTSDPLDAYYAGLGAVGSAFVDSLALQPQGLDRSAPIAQQVDVYETYARGLADNIRAARDDLVDLDPPPEVAQAHAAMLVTVENALTVAESLENELGSITSSEELQRITNNPDVATALQRFQDACNVLRDIAVENNVQRQVRCQ